MRVFTGRRSRVHEHCTIDDVQMMLQLHYMHIPSFGAYRSCAYDIYIMLRLVASHDRTNALQERLLEETGNGVALGPTTLVVLPALLPPKGIFINL